MLLLTPNSFSHRYTVLVKSMVRFKLTENDRTTVFCTYLYIQYAPHFLYRYHVGLSTGLVSVHSALGSVCGCIRQLGTSCTVLTSGSGVGEYGFGMLGSGTVQSCHGLNGVAQTSPTTIPHTSSGESAIRWNTKITSSCREHTQGQSRSQGHTNVRVGLSPAGDERCQIRTSRGGHGSVQNPIRTTPGVHFHIGKISRCTPE